MAGGETEVVEGGGGGRVGRVALRLYLVNKCHNIATPFKALLSLVYLIYLFDLYLLIIFISYLFLSRLYPHFELSHGGHVSASKYRRV